MLCRCSICQSEIELNEDIKYCPKCGGKITPTKKAQTLVRIFQCSNCSADLIPNAKFCSKCGSKIFYNQEHLSTKGKSLCWLLTFTGIFIIWGTTVLHGITGFYYSVIPVFAAFVLCQIYYAFFTHIKLSEINKHCVWAFVASMVILIVGYCAKA